MDPTCPICGTAGRTRNDVRRHLHVTHRKFEILDALLEESEPRPPEREGPAPA